MEEILHIINRGFISLPQDEVARNNQILGAVLDKITEVMKRNPLFDGLYQERYYGGSYYDGLKVGRPEEYDVDLLIKLPKCVAPRLETSEIPGFVHIRLDSVDALESDERAASKYPRLKREFVDDSYLLAHKVRFWMEGVIKRALNEFPITTNKAGPAFTLKLKGTVDGKPLKMDIDLVPCFVFGEGDWPSWPHRQNPVHNRPDFFVVPKRPNDKKDVEKCWRLSFQKQESVLINDLGRFKPVLRLLKKLRDTQDHACVASYYIKTIFLWKIDEGDRSFWNNSLAYVFMEMLRTFQQYLDRGEILFYWNDHNNLIERPKRITLKNFANRLNVIIRRIERNPENVSKFLLNSVEYQQFTTERDLRNRIEYEPLQAEQDLTNRMHRMQLEPEAAAAENRSENSTGKWLTWGAVAVGTGIVLAITAIANASRQGNGHRNN